MLPGNQFAKDYGTGRMDQPNLAAAFPRHSASPELAYEAADKALFDRQIQLVNQFPLHSSAGRTQITSDPHQLDMAYRIQQAHSTSGITARYKDQDAESSSDETGGGESKTTSKAGTPRLYSKSSAAAEIRLHAAVEKRYRQTVNTKLQQLYASIPESGQFSYDPLNTITGEYMRAQSDQAAKPVVLDKAIQYANHLIETYRKYDEDIESLKQQVRQWLEEDLLDPAQVSSIEGLSQGTA